MGDTTTIEQILIDLNAAEKAILASTLLPGQAVVTMQAGPVAQPTRFCKNCRWVERTRWLGRLKKNPRCLNPKNAPDAVYDLVTGREFGRRYLRCADARMHVGERCGSAGKLYQAASEARAALEALGG